MGFSRSPLLVKHAWKQTSCWEKIFYLTLSVRLYFGFCSLVHGVVYWFCEISTFQVLHLQVIFLSVCVIWTKLWGKLWDKLLIKDIWNSIWIMKMRFGRFRNWWNHQYCKYVIATSINPSIVEQKQNKMQHCVDKFVLILVSKSGKVPFSLQDWFPKVTL